MKIINTYGHTLGINGDAELMQDGLKPVIAADLSIYGGMPMTFYTPSGATEVSLLSYKYLKGTLGISANVKVAGLAKFNKNTYLDETNDPMGYNGSGRGTVIVAGRVTLSGNTFRQLDGSMLTVFPFITSLSYKAMDKLYVDLTLDSQGDPSSTFGKITNVLVDSGDSQNGKTEFGYVSNFWPSATTPCMEVVLSI